MGRVELVGDGGSVDGLDGRGVGFGEGNGSRSVWELEGSGVC